MSDLGSEQQAGQNRFAVTLLKHVLTALNLLFWREALLSNQSTILRQSLLEGIEALAACATLQFRQLSVLSNGAPYVSLGVAWVSLSHQIPDCQRAEFLYTGTKPIGGGH